MRYAQGSTGQPKGVQLEHAGVADLLQYYASMCPSIIPGDSFLQSMSFFFGESSLPWALQPLAGTTCVES